MYLFVMRLCKYGSQLALRKFQRLYGLLGTEAKFVEAIISDDQCWDAGNFSRMHVSNRNLS